MCGIVGLSMSAGHPNAPEVTRQMANLISHRGPDSDGYQSFASGASHVGFRRLAIRDRRPAANQPMTSASGRTAIVFNGEVYNSAELAAKYLQESNLRTTGDTEVVLECWETRGLDVLPELNGMFAMAIIDVQSGDMTLVRDRMGKKPLYVYQRGGLVAFSSELKALRPFGLTVDPRYIELFLHLGYFPSPHTFFQGTTQVCPGEVVILRAGRVSARRRFHQFSEESWSRGGVQLDELDQLIHNSVQLRRLSDVPLGAFLSGGLDSALVAAQLASSSPDAPSTFTVAFPEQTHDESDDAVATAEELRLPHRVIRVEDEDLADLAIGFQDCYEQPYADTSGLATMLLCRAVKEHITVALSGDGGDEFFGGYARYSWFRKALEAQRFPAMARKLIGFGLPVLDRQRGKRLSRWLNAADPAELYAQILRQWNATRIEDVLDSSLTRQSAVRAVDLVRQVFTETGSDSLANAACFDATYYIPDDLQAKLDRASMRVALEVRCPLLDYRVSRLGLEVATGVKYCDGLKGVLRQLLGRHVSAKVLDRPKHGFNVPLARWLRGPMKSVVADSLASAACKADWLDSQTLRRVWEAFLDGKSHYAHEVWTLFSLSQHLEQPAADPAFASLYDRRAQRSKAAA